MAEPVPKMPADWELRPAPEDADDPFRFGWRPRYVHLPGGEVEEERIPLTAEDLLDPQIGDVDLTQGGPHAKVSHRLGGILETFFEDDPEVLVLWDVKMLWGIPGLKEPSPDVAVIRGAWDKEEVREVFNVPLEGVRPCLIVEVVSPKYEEVRRNDYVEKKEIYERAGIAEYLIVEPFRVRGNPIRQWTGYRLGPDGCYRQIEPDGEGRLLSKTTGLLFGVDEDRSLLVINARTGERLLNSSQLAAARKAAEELADRDARRADREAETRKAAEERATREAGRADREAEVRKAAEAEVARLQAELERIAKG
ncbi:MAG TPA: Uma2 family endonuclease [Thermoanaerobaculia bacterium]|nr:Uma2 family endonuclease [Thermoanaerobaculia bacterium]